jgi:hypothetical protein
MSDRPSRVDRLAAQIVHAERVRALAAPITCYLIRVLTALAPGDVEELSRWQLRNEQAEAVVDRVTGALGEPRLVVRGALSDCLRLDVWGDYGAYYAEVERRYRMSGEADQAIERVLGRPPSRYPLLIHRVIGVWRPGQADYSMLTIEDDRRAAACEGYLVAHGRAFPTNLSLLEVSVREQWQGWPLLWRWF